MRKLFSIAEKNNRNNKNNRRWAEHEVGDDDKNRAVNVWDWAGQEAWAMRLGYTYVINRDKQYSEIDHN